MRYGRYPWPLQRSLYAHALCEVLADYEAEASVEVGPPALLPGGESGEGARRRLRGDLEAFAHEAPFTLQRLAEVLLEPRKQYARLDKLVRVHQWKCILLLKYASYVTVWSGQLYVSISDVL